MSKKTTASLELWHNNTRVEIGIGRYRRNIELTDELKGPNQRNLKNKERGAIRFCHVALKINFFDAQVTEF